MLGPSVLQSHQSTNRFGNIFFQSALDKRKADGNMVLVINCRLDTFVSEHVTLLDSIL